MPIISAYRKDTGERVEIPEHWLEHPKLGLPFSRTEPTETVADPSTPADTWTVPQLRAHAHRNGIDIAGATTKAEILTAVTAPAAGDPKE